MGAVTARVLLVEDDPVIGEATQLHLERNGYAVVRTTDGLDAWDRWRADGPFDVVLSDIMLPGLDGVTLCRRIRAESGTPIVLVSARADAVDVVLGLEAGADDYVVKPFDVQVLLARLRSVTRRVERPRTPDPGPTDQAARVERFGDLELDRDALELRRAGRPLSLTPTEMRLFLELADAPGVVLSRTTLLRRVWDYGEWADDQHLVNVHVQRLRTKIGAERIETVRGFGFKLRR